MSIPDDADAGVVHAADRPPAGPRSTRLLAGKPNEAKKTLGARDRAASTTAPRPARRRAGRVEEAVRGARRPGRDPRGDDRPRPTWSTADAGGRKLIVAGSASAKSNNEARQKIKEGAFNYGPDRTKPADAKGPSRCRPAWWSASAKSRIKSPCG